MTRHHNRRGFSLIEAAIVLAVVGLVIGGIWWAASAVRETYMVSQAVKDLFSTIQGTRKLTKGFSITAGNVTQAMVEAGVIPKTLCTGINGSGRCIMPFESNYMVLNANVNYTFTIQFFFLSTKKRICVKILREFTKFDFVKNGIKSVGGSLSQSALSASLQTNFPCNFNPVTITFYQ